jgi:predicted transglutaminase-like cysteine proteinase
MLNPAVLSRSARALRRSLFAWALCLISTPAWADIAAPNAIQLPINAAQARLNNWQQLVNSAGTLDNASKLRAVNDLINSSTLYASDPQTWGHNDYWASLHETLKRGQGDCEDFAIAKYFTLIEMGIPTPQLRLTHATELSHNSAHMVLAYYPSPHSQPLILDNLNGHILPLNQRQDLLAIYAFNAEGIYLSRAPAERIAQPVSLLSHWTALNTRMQRSGNLL